MIRFCPHCHTKRPLTEIFCEGDINNQTCGWDLTLEPIHDEDWEAPNKTRLFQLTRLKIIKVLT